MPVAFGRNIKVDIYGASHADRIGVKIDGLPAGLPVDMKKLQAFLDRRAPGRNAWSTPRKEADAPEIISGLKEGVTDGSTLEAVIYNTNIRPADYGNVITVPRPGHADLPAIAKGIDIVGGGPFSGRLTAAVVAGGSLARQFVKNNNIEISAFTKSIGSVKDVKERTFRDSVASEIYATRACSSFLDADMRKEIEAASEMGDSVGGVTECIVTGLPIGFGGIRFNALDSEIARAMFSIPACKGIEIGRAHV